MKPVPFAVIGVGHLGGFHATLAAQIESIDLRGVFDLDRARAHEIAETTGTKAFDDLDQLLHEVRAVSVVVPTAVHYEVAVMALEHGCHVFIEKPITQTVEEGTRLVELAAHKGLKLQVGHIERFNPAVLSLKEHTLEPMFIESHRLSQFNPRGTDVSVILDLMIHDIDIILTLIDSPLCSVDACGVAVVSEAEDIANVRLGFKNGAVANITSSRISVNPMRKMRMFQKNMYIAIDFLKKSSEIFSLIPEDAPMPSGFSMTVDTIGVGEMKKKIIYEKPVAPQVNSLQYELETFARCIQEDTRPAVTGREAVRALELASIIQGKIKRPGGSACDPGTFTLSNPFAS